MATVADYAALSDSTKVLKIGGDIDQTYSFSLPANINRDSNALSTWQFEAESNPSSLAWNLKVNGTQIAGYVHGSRRRWQGARGHNHPRPLLSDSAGRDVYEASLVRLGS